MKSNLKVLPLIALTAIFCVTGALAQQSPPKPMMPPVAARSAMPGSGMDMANMRSEMGKMRARTDESFDRQAEDPRRHVEHHVGLQMQVGEIEPVRVARQHPRDPPPKAVDLRAIKKIQQPLGDDRDARPRIQ